MPMMTPSYADQKAAAIAGADARAYVPPGVPEADVPHAAVNCTPAEFRHRETGAVVHALALNGALPNYLALRQWTGDLIEGWDPAGQTALLSGAPVAQGDLVVADADGFRAVPAAEFTAAYEMIAAETGVELADLSHADGPDPASLMR